MTEPSMVAAAPTSPRDAGVGSAGLDAGTTALPSTGLLSFYDRLRRRLTTYAEWRGGRLGAGVATALLLVPDVLLLLLRLSLDREVPARERALIAGALAYFVLPVDLLPEGVIGPMGFLDDLVLATAVLSTALAGPLEPLAERHWSGPGRLRVVLRDVSTTAQALVGFNLYRRLARLLERRFGVRLPA